MPNYPVLVDSSTGKYKRDSNLGGFADYFFTVTSGGGQSSFVVAGGVVTVNGKIDVWWNGVMQDEGGGATEWTRNTGSNSIDFNFTIPQNGKVRVRLYS